MKKNKKLPIIAILFVLFSFAIILAGCSDYPKEMSMYYFDVETGNTEKVVSTRNGGYFKVRGSEKDSSYNDFRLPQQELKGWEFLGYLAENADDSYSLSKLNDFKEENFVKLGYDKLTIFKQFSGIHKKVNLTAVWKKEAARITVVDYKGGATAVQWYRYIGYTPSGHEETLLQRASVQAKLREKIVTSESDLNMLGGLYDAPMGGVMVINQYLNALCEMSDLWGRNVYMRYKTFSLEINENKASQSHEIELNQSMPDLPSVQAPQGESLVGWFIKGTTVRVDSNGLWQRPYDKFAQSTYAQYLRNGKIFIEARFERKTVKMSFSGYADKQYKYGQFVDFIPTPPTAHQTFIGWSAADEKPFDGFACEDMTLNPRWAYKQYKFEFVLDGGTSLTDIGSFEVVYLQDISGLPNQIEKEGYSFVGWFASLSETSEQYSDNTGTLLSGKNILTENIYTINQSGVIKLYAHYESN